MRVAEAMVVFYNTLGFDVAELPAVDSVYAGSQMINFHRPETWQKEGFTLRAPAAPPPCGDLCCVWGGPQESLHERRAGAGAAIEEGPVKRHAGRRAEGTSTYT